MPPSLDPYHRWLGISPKDQPPNHYRLLALALFEPDVEVIRDAAQQRIVHVRAYQSGPHGELAQKILAELTAAEACLLDPVDKAAYDAQLRAELPPEPAPEPVPLIAPPRVGEKRSADRRPLLAAAAILVCAAVAAFFWAVGAGQPVDKKSPSPPSRPVEMYVGEKKIASGDNWHHVETVHHRFAKGDRIFVKAENEGGPRGFCCAIRLDDGTTLSSPTGWHAYKPESTVFWYDPKRTAELLSNGKAKSPAAKPLKKACGIDARVIWGTGNPCYLYFEFP
jgi:hypothetical protein